MSQFISDNRTELVRLSVGGRDVEAVLCRPSEVVRGGVVLGAEAVGINGFIVGVARQLADAGYLSIVPDYFHGEGPPDPDAIYNWDHVQDIQHYIHELDFRRGTEDMLVALDYLREVEKVSRVAMWGYCTGGTLSMMAGCLGREVDATVLFYPSQPRFDELSARTPAHPIDLLWAMHGSVLLLIGADDQIWPAELVSETRARLSQHGISHEIVVYEGADHVFAGHFGDSYRPVHAEDAWKRAVSFISEHFTSR